jgi:hypothetical protein
MTLNSFEKLKQTPKHHIQETIAVIEEDYTFLQQHLKMEYCNAAGENSVQIALRNTEPSKTSRI